MVVPATLIGLAPGQAGGSSIVRTRTAASPVAGAWRVLPKAPISVLDQHAVSVWTGTEMLVFGRVTSRAGDGDVLGRVYVTAAYDPATGIWRRLPDLDSANAFYGFGAVWTGTEMLVWGQGTQAAFDPQTSRWRQLPAPPQDGFGLVVWTGREMIGWGGGCCGDAWADGAAYDPAANRWRKLAASPLAGRQRPSGAWTGRELIVFGGSDADGHPLRGAAAYDPVTDRWRRIAALPAPRLGATAVWDGREVLAVGGTGAPRGGRSPALAAVGLAYDPTTNRWRRLPPMESGREGAAAVWTGTQLLVWGGRTARAGSPLPVRCGDVPTPCVTASHGLAYDPEANRWAPLPTAPLRGRLNPTAVWTGQAMIVWGGGTERPPYRDITSGALFTPAVP